MPESSKIINFNKRNEPSNIAEDLCISWMKKDGEYRRLGFDEKNDRVKSKTFYDIPHLIRCLPDFVWFKDCYHFFIEVKGCTDSLKMKIRDWLCYERWNEICEGRLYFYIYSVKTGRSYWIALQALRGIMVHHQEVRTKVMDKDTYSEKKYYDIPIELLFSNKLGEVNNERKA